MEIALLAVLGGGAVALGALVTSLLAELVPHSVVVRAQEHGRYAGLSGDDAGGGAGSVRATGYPKLGKQLANGC